MGQTYTKDNPASVAKRDLARLEKYQILSEMGLRFTDNRSKTGSLFSKAAVPSAVKHAVEQIHKGLWGLGIGSTIANPLPPSVRTWSHPSTLEAAAERYRQAVARANEPSKPGPQRAPKVVAEHLYTVTLRPQTRNGIEGVQVNLGWQETATADRPGQQIGNFDDEVDRSQDFLLPWPGARKQIEEYRWMDLVSVHFANSPHVIRRGEEFWVSKAIYNDFMAQAKSLLQTLSKEAIA